ncbi:MAG: phosphoribosylglycinamide synthetase [Bifidobacterium sp.]|nr:phosphoribosylglycinamide synthetase [Bifidobacterium sp.]
MDSFPNPWGVDLADHRNVLKIASERLSLVRYVFLVQIEDGIASAAQRASLEYADAVLIGWPERDDPEVVDVDGDAYRSTLGQMRLMEDYIGKFRAMERAGDIDGMTDTLIRITERVAHVRRMFQPSFPLPTFAEIRRVVQDEWGEDMGRINHESAAQGAKGKDGDPTLASLQEEFDQLMDDTDGAVPAPAGDGQAKA